MGVTCGVAPPTLSNIDSSDGSTGNPLGPREPASAAPKADVPVLPRDSPGTNQASESSSSPLIHKNLSCPQPSKKSVRIDDTVTLIPLLTSASFLRKTTPRPTTTTTVGYGGMMRSFRIVLQQQQQQQQQREKDDKEETNDADLVPRSSLWWTKEEKREILLSNQRASRDFKRSHPTQVREANLVYDKIVTDCIEAQQDSDDDSDSDHDNNDIYHFFQTRHLRRRLASVGNHNTTHSKKRKRGISTSTTTDPAAPLSVVQPKHAIYLPATVRGLEWGVLPDAKRYRKAHCHTVLKLQDRFREQSEANAVRRKRRRKTNNDDDTNENNNNDDDAAARGGEDRDHEQLLLLGRKASISSRRSCLLALALGRSDAINARSEPAEASDDRTGSGSPAPSLASTTDESSSSSDEDDEGEGEGETNAADSDDSDDSDSDESDSEDDDDGEDENTPGWANRGIRYPLSSSSSSPPWWQTNSANTYRRTFRPRMMPPMSWR